MPMSTENKEKAMEKPEIEAEPLTPDPDDIDGLPRYQRAMARIAMRVGIIKKKEAPQKTMPVENKKRSRRP
jgi:hypothetical protein